jgi:hypothetical protein
MHIVFDVRVIITYAYAIAKYQMETFQVRILWTPYIYLRHKQKTKRISA